ncbi:MAG: FtsW/RodA/SpoVE family cell cycle protein [Fimbriimonadales bacterium]
MRKRSRVAPVFGGDPIVLWLTAILLAAGTFSVFNASYATAIRRGESIFGGEVIRHFMWLAAAIATYYFVAKMRWTDLKRNSGLFFAIVFVLCLLVYVPGIGYSVRGASRWINLRVGNLQPSELMKPVIILYVAGLLTQSYQANRRRVRDWIEVLDFRVLPWISKNRGWIFIALVLLLIEKQPDLGSALAVGACMFGVLLIGGVKLRHLGFLLAACAIVFTYFAFSKGYRADRFLYHQDRWSASDTYGYQPVQSEKAMAVGGPLGVGIAHGQAKHVLPAATTDYAFTTIAEEFGLWGSLFAIGLLAALSLRLLFLSIHAQTPWCRMVMGGVGWWLGVQSALNVLMVGAALPSVGIPLPFISYGGSSLVAIAIGLGAAHACSKKVENLEASRATDRHRRRYGRTRLTRA